jgi:hypothetical protein
MQKAATANSCVKCALSSLGCSPVLRGAIDDLAVRIHAVAVSGLHVDDLCECVALCQSPYAYTSIIERIKSSPDDRLHLLSATIAYGLVDLSSSWPSCEVVESIIKYAGPP